MDDIKTRIWGWEGRMWGGRLLLNLGMLSLYTGTGPVANICIDTGPYKPGRNELPGCLDSWMRQTMKGFKHSTSPCHWDEGALWTCHSKVGW